MLFWWEVGISAGPSGKSGRAEEEEGGRGGCGGGWAADTIGALGWGDLGPAPAGELCWVVRRSVACQPSLRLLFRLHEGGGERRDRRSTARRSGPAHGR